MKKIAVLLAGCLISLAGQAQTIIEKHFDYSGKSSVTADIQIADSIKIIPWNKDEVYVRASVNVNDNKDNDQYKWTFDNTGNNIDITAKFPEEDFWSKNHNSCCLKIEIYCELHVPYNAPLSLETINGNLILTKSTKELHLKTISGFIDFSAPADLKADMRFKTVTGLVYTNFDLSKSARDHSGPTRFSFSLNGGRFPMELETISGNIYFRKLD